MSRGGHQSSHMVDRTALMALMRAHMKAHGLTRSAAATQLGLTFDGLVVILYGRVSPSADALLSIMRWLGISDITAITVRRDGEPDPAPEPFTAQATAPPVARASSWQTMADQVMAAFHAAQADTPTPTPTHTPGTLPGDSGAV